MKVLIEGWTDYPHSYSIVNVYHLIHFLEMDNVEILFRKCVAYKPEWETVDIVDLGFLTRCQKDEIESKTIGWTRPLPDDIDLVFRVSYPYNIGPVEGTGKQIPIVLFYTSEFRVLDDKHFVGGTLEQFKVKVQNREIFPVTPSNWSAKAISDIAVPVIPHGVDSTVFSKLKKQEHRVQIRSALNIPQSDIVLLHVGAMTENKNVKAILKSFYAVSLLQNNVTLVLKGLGNLYQSKDRVKNIIKTLCSDHTFLASHWKKLSKKFIFIEDTLSQSEMAALYHAADLYVSPYIAEGFNMPCMESLACGTPLMVTQGGPTDDFVPKSAAVFVKNTELVNKETKEIYLMTSDLNVTETLLKTLSELTTLKVPEDYSQIHSWKDVCEQYVNLFQVILNFHRH